MAVKVLITRKLKDGKYDEVYRLLMELRSAATLQDGYISGETLINVARPNELVVISTWASQKRWEEWCSHSKRQEFAAKLSKWLEYPEQVEVFLVGEKPPEWVHMA